MTDNESSTIQSADLRQRAEEMLRRKDDRSPQELVSLSPAEYMKILHELRVREIELEMQKEELLRTQFELSTERERYFNLYDLAPVGYITLSEKGLILEANLTAAGLLGVERGRLVKQWLSHFILKDDQDIYNLHLKLLFESEEPQGFDLRLVKKDGTPFWTHLAATTTRDGEGVCLCSVMIIDITKRKQADEAIKLATQKTTGILESITDAFFTLDENLVTTYFNAAAERLLNRNRQDVIGRNLCDAFPEAKGSIFEEKYTLAIHEKKTLSFETYFGVKPYENWYEVRVYPQQDGISVFFQVVTERKQAEDVLKQSEERFNLAISGTGAGLWDWDIEKDVVYFSPRWKSMLGYADHEVENAFSGWKDLWHPDDAARIEQAVTDYLEGRTTRYEIEHRLRHKDGSWRWILTRGDIQRDTSGKTVRWVGTNLDVTERKQVEEALSKSELSFRALAENSGDYIMRYDHEHRHVYANHRAIQVSGKTSAEYIGKTHREMGFPEDMCALWESAIDKVFATGQPYREIFKWESAAGAIVLDWRLFPEMDSHGHVIFVLGVSRDITERLEAEQVLAKSEEKFRTLASLAPVGIYLTNPDGTCLYTNPTWQNMAGLSAEEALGNGWVNGIHPDDREMVFSNWQKMVDSQGEWGLEYRFQNREGKTTIVFGLATAQKDPSGNIVGYIGVNIDITERKQAEIFSKNLVTMNPVSIQVLDTQGFTLEVNPAFKLLFGSVPPADYSIFTDPQLAQQGIGEIFDQLRNGKVVHFPDVSFNPHDSIAAMPDVPNWVRTIGFPICSENEIPERFVLMQENITEKKNAEVTLRDSEFKFRQTFDVSPVGIVMVGLDTRLIDCNLAFSKSLGYETQELTGKLIEEITLPEDRQIGKAEMMAILKGELTKSQIQKRYLRKDGQVIWGEVTLSIIRDTNGHAQYFLALVQDITVRKQAEEKLIISEKYFRSLFEQAASGIAITDAYSGKFLKINQAFCEILGYTLEEMRDVEFKSLTHPADVSISLEKMNLLLTGAISKFSIEKRYIRKNGSVVWVDLSVASMWEPGDSPNSYISIVQDITPRKKIEQALLESEERYRFIDEASQDMIYSYDRQSRFTHANSSLCKRMGLRPEQIIGKTHEELGFPQDQCDGWAKLHQQVYDTNSTVISETITPIQGGEPQYFEVVLNPIHDDTGAIMGIAGTTRDINARKQAEAKITAQLIELRRWNNATLGREDRIMELKREVNKLLAEAGKPPHYASVAEVYPSRGEK